jgi:uncharacterized protein (DUF1501 family)
MSTDDDQPIDPTRAYDDYAQPVDGDADEHYFTHGADIEAEDPAGGGEARRPLSRRRFIQGAAVAGTAGFAVFQGTRPSDPQSVESMWASRRASTATTTGSTTPLAGAQIAGVSEAVPSAEVFNDLQVAQEVPLLTPAPPEQRVLVLIEFQGGNDGLSMVVPYANGRYYDRRPGLAIPAEEVHVIDDQVGLAPGLSRISQRQVATVEGVGPVDGSLSHFEMVERWEQGDMRGVNNQRSGYLARVSDVLDAGAAVTGLSVAGHTPRFNASLSSTLSISNLNQLRVITKNDWIYPQYRSALRSFGGGPMSTMITESWNKLFDVGDSISGDFEKVDNDSPMIREGQQLGRQLAMAAELIKADAGVRVVHAAMGGFDTHDNHRGRHDQLMQRFDAAVAGFLDEMEAAGLADRVLVATSSEFGRRVSQNGSGLDHGAASSMLLLGPVRPGRVGDPSPLNDLDRNGNLRTTIPFDRYLATLAQDWLAVEAASILPEAPAPLGLF